MISIKMEKIMKTKKYIHWQEDDMFIGYPEDYPDYMTQGETIEKLKENLRDLFKEFTSGNIPCVRRVDELEIT
jgi:predicted RNase H-like HicB family nuclease